jgi:hypothetical protein
MVQERVAGIAGFHFWNVIALIAAYERRAS